MAQLRQDHEHYRSRDALVAAIGPDSESDFKRYWEEHKLPFTGLPDEKHSVLKLYGQEVKLFKLGRQPAQMLIDKQGLLRFVHYGHNMSDIPGNEEMIALLDRLEAE